MTVSAREMERTWQEGSIKPCDFASTYHFKIRFSISRECGTSLFKRAIASERIRSEAYSDLMNFTSIMATVAPELVVALAKAELMEELPQERIDRLKREERAYIESMNSIRAIPGAGTNRRPATCTRTNTTPDRIRTDRTRRCRNQRSPWILLPGIGAMRAVHESIREKFGHSPPVSPRLGEPGHQGVAPGSRN